MKIDWQQQLSREKGQMTAFQEARINGVHVGSVYVIGDKVSVQTMAGMGHPLVQEADDIEQGKVLAEISILGFVLKLMRGLS